jgi:hypothetical protein
VGVAVKVTLVPEQIVVAEAAILTLTGRLGFTVMVTVLEVAGLPVAQVAFEVITQVTVLPFARAVLVYVELLVPTLEPLSFHWYTGVVPPLVGVAVKVTLVPEQIVVAEAAILTLAGKFGFTVIVTVLEVAGLPVAQVALDVSTQVTTSLFTNEPLLYVALFEPTLLPFTFHK